jgi:hypothetical protein
MMFMDYESDIGATCLLRDAVRSAYEHVLRRGCDLPTVNEALAELLVAVAPSLDRLMSTAAALPAGPTAAALEHLRCAFGHAARGLPGPAVVSMMAAATTTFRLVDSEAHDAEGANVGRSADPAPTTPGMLPGIQDEHESGVRGEYVRG